MVLPLTNLQGEIRGLTGRNVLKQQLQTGKIDMPSMTSSFKETGVVTFGLKEEETDLTASARRRGKDNTISEESAELICQESSADGNS